MKQVMTVVAAVCLGAFLTHANAQPARADGGAAPAAHVEYKVEMSMMTKSGVEETLGKMAAQGWRFTQTLPSRDGPLLVFERAR